MYSEEQKIKNKFVVAIYVLAVIVALIALVISIWQANLSGDADSINALYIIIVFMFIAMAIAYLAIFRTTLTITLDDYSITFEYFPFLRKPLPIEFSSIKTWQHRKLKSIFDYGGYGYRKDFLQKKTGFIINGKEIFELKLISGRTIGFTAANKTMMFLELQKQLPEKQIK